MAQKRCQVCGDYYDSSEKVCPYCGDGEREQNIVGKRTDHTHTSVPKRKKSNPLALILLGFSVLMGIIAMVYTTNVVTKSSVNDSIEVVIEEEKEDFVAPVEEVVEYTTSTFSTGYVNIEGDSITPYTYIPSDNNIVPINLQDQYTESLEFSTNYEPFYLYYNVDEYYYDLSSYYDYSLEYFLDMDGYVYEDTIFHIIIGDLDEKPGNEMIINVEDPSGLYSTKIFKILIVDGEELIVEIFTTDFYEYMSLEDDGLLIFWTEDYIDYYHFIENDVVFLGSDDDMSEEMARESLLSPFEITSIASSGTEIDSKLTDHINQSSTHFEVDLPYTMTVTGLENKAVSQMIIYNGDFNNYEDFWGNGRVEAFYITFPDGTEEYFDLLEDDTSVLFEFDQNTTDTFDITITDIFEGDSYSGFNISEIKFYE